jgi:hypothetical protein
MATTGSSGLNNALSNTAVTQTTLPSWYDTAQQNIINQAGTAQQAAPSFGQTTAQGAVNTLQGPANPFTQAQGTLNQIATGAANPWIVDPTTGAVTPNTSTAMGGLFSAQQNQLNTMLPSLTSGAEGAAIGSGNFGSLRGQTAVDTAKTQALANLQAQQMQSALQNQQQGVSAATGLGNVGQAGINANLTTGTAQMNAPFNSVGNYANLVNAVNAPTTASQQTQLSPLTMIGSVGSALSGGLSGLSSLYGTTAGKNILNSLGLGSLFSNSGSPVKNTVSPTLPDGSPNPDFIGPVRDTVNPTLPDGSPNPDFIGPVDSGPVDSGPVDSGPVDSGPVDSGPVDSGNPP